ncbi:cytochrome P450 [Striga asiatica]|uniref:Cytochrome P450 n=1 Tax=Striga asiatica TaxID=4170 RepID=A0A5A7PEJ2_STRAF|nr:cytochrome P450 [Striga asiatica]
MGIIKGQRSDRCRIKHVRVRKPVAAEHLIIRKGQRPLHRVKARLSRVHLIVVPTARLASREVSYEGSLPAPPPPFSGPLHLQPLFPRLTIRLTHLLRPPPPQPRLFSLHSFVLLCDVLQRAHNLHPVPFEIVFSLHARLIVRLREYLVLEGCAQGFTPLVVIRGLWAHPGPDVHEVHGPLAVADEKDAGVDAGPALFFDHVGPAVDDEVVGLVPVEREDEVHVREGGVRVDPPDPLGFRVGQHCGADGGGFGPEGEHLGLEEGVVVEDVDVVAPAVVHFVLEQLQEEVVADRVPARRRLRARHHEDPALGAGGEGWVLSEPLPPLLVPVFDGWGVDGVRQLRIVVEVRVGRVDPEVRRSGAARGSGSCGGGGFRPLRHGGRPVGEGRCGEIGGRVRVGAEEGPHGPDEHKGHEGSDGEEKPVGDKRRCSVPAVGDKSEDTILKSGGRGNGKPDPEINSTKFRHCNFVG